CGRRNRDPHLRRQDAQAHRPAALCHRAVSGGKGAARGELRRDCARPASAELIELFPILTASPPGLTRGSILLRTTLFAVKMVSTFTRVFRRALPGVDDPAQG